MQVDEVSLIIDIACRYDRVLQAAGLQAACSADELACRLIAAHNQLPINLAGLRDAEDVELVIAVGDIQMGLVHRR